MDKYIISEQLFLDVWEAYGSKPELTDLDEIVCFLNDLIKRSNGQIIVDHFSQENYDLITRVERVGDYVKIVWRDFDFWRRQYKDGSLSDFDRLSWSIFNYATYIYSLLNIDKIKITQRNGHTYILFRTSLLEPKTAERFLKQRNNKVLFKRNEANLLYADYRFQEGEDNDFIIHECTAYTLPFYSVLLQPKENCLPAFYSHVLLVLETLEEIQERFNRTVALLNSCRDEDTDDIEAKGNTIRKLMEYALKYFCIYNKIEVKDIDQKYQYITLGDLRKSVLTHGINISQSLVNEANRYSHDSGTTHHKQEVHRFAEQVQSMLKQIKDRISTDLLRKVRS